VQLILCSIIAFIGEIPGARGMEVIHMVDDDKKKNNVFNASVDFGEAHDE